jgi:hypothetical protein
MTLCFLNHDCVFSIVIKGFSFMSLTIQTAPSLPSSGAVGELPSQLQGQLPVQSPVQAPAVNQHVALAEGNTASVEAPRYGKFPTAHYWVTFGNASKESTSSKETKARLAAAGLSPKQVTVNGQSYFVYNGWFDPANAYNSRQLSDLMSLSKQKGLFHFVGHPKSGLVPTSDTENATMLRQWFTDSMYAGLIQKDTDPKGWSQALTTSAGVLNSSDARQAVVKTVENPDWFRKGGVMNGVPHIYQPKSVAADAHGVVIPEQTKIDKHWFNQKRLESQALTLYHLADTLEKSFELDGQPRPKWAFAPDDILNTKKGVLLRKALVDLTAYLKAVHFNPDTNKFDFEAPSASSWEELPFEEGMTSDAAFTTMALAKVRHLMTAPTENKALLQFRHHITHEKSMVKLPDDKALQAAVEEGRAFVEKRVNIPLAYGDKPIQTPSRPADTSLLLLAASEYELAPGNAIKDAELRMGVVKSTLEALRGSHGVRRYNAFERNGAKLHDSYLNRDYHFNQAYGSSDASTEEDMLKRQQGSSEAHSAEWGLGLSAALQAAAKAKLDVLTAVKKSNKPMDKTAKQVVAEANTLIADLLNTIYGLIPEKQHASKPLVRADGTHLSDNKMMEAFEVLTDSNGKHVRVPGAHTLPWHEAQTYDGLKKAMQAQQLEEAMTLDKSVT